MTRRAYINENELLLLEATPSGNWIPAIRAMTAATEGRVRVYLTDGDTIVTYGSKPLKWPLLGTTTYDGMDSQWLDMRMVYLLSEKDMTAFETWRLNPVPGTRWESVRRPMPHMRRPVEATRTVEATRPVEARPEARPPAPRTDRITHLALLGAEASGAICPITTEPIRASHATMTPCGHVFDRAALALWTSTNPVCPECRASL
jgi:hypothetical protein